MFILTLILACSSGKDTGLDCSNPPTYSTWAKGFLDGKCQSCHASTSSNRHGAPANVYFDNEAAALVWKERIYATIFEESSMPPSGGVTLEEVILLEQWLECGNDSES